jgi:hypothetical protein
MAMRVTEMGASEGCPVIGQIEVASPRWDKITSPETELTSRWCSSSRPLEEPMKEAKQMTTVQAVGAASHTMVAFSTAVRVGRRSVSRRFYLMLNKAAASFFRGAFLNARAG